jgi:hypothetical protein
MLTANACEIETNIILLVGTGPMPLTRAPHGAMLAQRLKRAGHKLDDTPFVTDLPNVLGSRRWPPSRPGKAVSSC